MCALEVGEPFPIPVGRVEHAHAVVLPMVPGALKLRAIRKIVDAQATALAFETIGSLPTAMKSFANPWLSPARAPLYHQPSYLSPLA